MSDMAKVAWGAVAFLAFAFVLAVVLTWLT